MVHHTLDIYPIHKKVLFINEPQLADRTVLELHEIPESEIQSKDNVRIYIPLDLNQKAILRRLRTIYRRYGSPTEANESALEKEIGTLVSQIKLYDQVWFAREEDFGNGHSEKAIHLVKQFQNILREKKGWAEISPYDLVETLEREFSVGCV